MSLSPDDDVLGKDDFRRLVSRNPFFMEALRGCFRQEVWSKEGLSSSVHLGSENTRVFSSDLPLIRPVLIDPTAKALRRRGRSLCAVPSEFEELEDGGIEFFT